MKRDTILIKLRRADESEVIERTLSAVAESHQRFFNCTHRLLHLNAKERAFYDYLCEQMNSTTNKVVINRPFKEMFINDIKTWTSGKVVISLNSVNQYTVKLAEIGLIINMNPKSGLYAVNPRFAFKGNKTERKRAFQDLMQELYQQAMSIQPFLNEPEDSFLKGTTL